jgi:quinohemoprotein ethanol dehydrogenase
VCHGPFAASSGVLPDLRWSPITANADAWNSVLIDGVLAKNGMVSFAEYLTDEDAEAIRAYVVSQARADMNIRGVD